MIRVPFNPSDLAGEDKDWWDTWCARADLKTAYYVSEVGEGRSCKFDGSVWSDLKTWLLKKVFHGKCAYCENKVDGSFFGEAEHYRPKGNVTVKVGDVKGAACLPTGAAHPGYYWLAYDWENLLPSCQKCNNAKSDMFPVAGDYNASVGHTVAALNDVEAPLLINPYTEDPSLFLRFGKNGVVAAIDGNAKGRATIATFGLDRQELMDERWDTQTKALEGLQSTLGQLLTGDEPKQERVDRYMGPGARFSRAVIDWFTEEARLAFKKIEAMAQKAQGNQNSI